MAIPLATAWRKPLLRNSRARRPAPAGHADREGAVGELAELVFEPDRRKLAGYQFSGPAGLGVGADGGHHRDRGACLDGGSGVEHAATLGQHGSRRGFDLLLHRQRLPGERGFVDFEVVFLDQPGVGGDHLVGAHLDHVAGPQLCRLGVGVDRRTVGTERHFPRRRNLLGQQFVESAFGAQALAGGQHGVTGEHRPDQYRVDGRTQHRTRRRAESQHRGQRVGQFGTHRLEELPGGSLRASDNLGAPVGRLHRPGGQHTVTGLTAS